MSTVEKLCLVRNGSADCVAGVFRERDRADAFALKLEQDWKQKYFVTEVTSDSAGKAWPVFLKLAI